IFLFVLILSIFFFFQAEDGIRDFHVTGVQTCALPIWTLKDEIARAQFFAHNATTKIVPILIESLNLKYLAEKARSFKFGQWKEIEEFYRINKGNIRDAVYAAAEAATAVAAARAAARAAAAAAEAAADTAAYSAARVAADAVCAATDYAANRAAAE